MSTVGVNCLLLKADLLGRIKRVKVRDDALSDEQEARRGVRQGSVLRPLLFVFLSYFNLFVVIFYLFLFIFIFIYSFFFFINDFFPQIKTVQMNMYAGDGQLHTSNTDLVSLEGRVSVVVNSANAWYENNRIIDNPSKHQGMLL